jgi:hypothetical protein
LQATAGDASITVSWDAVTGADGYYVVYTDCSQNKVSDIFDLPYKNVTNATQAVLTELTNGQSYQIVVKSYSGSNQDKAISTESGIVMSTPKSGTSEGCFIGTADFEINIFGLLIFIAGLTLFTMISLVLKKMAQKRS